MTSAVKQTNTEREESFFSRAARAIRRALSRICGGSSPPSPVNGDIPLHPQPDYIGFHRRPQSDTDNEPRRPPLFDTYYEPRRPPQSVTDYEPRRPPQSDTDNEPRRPPLSDTYYEPRRPPLFYTDYEPRRPPLFDTYYEPRHPLSDTYYEPRRPPLFDTYYEPRRPPLFDTYYEPRHPLSDTYYEPRHPLFDTYYEPRRPPQSDTDYEPRRPPQSDTDNEPRRPPLSYTYYEPRRPHLSYTDYEPRHSRQSDTDFEPRHSRQSDTDYEPRRPPQSDTDNEPRRPPLSYTYYEPRRPHLSYTDYEPRHSRQSDTDFEPRRSRQSDLDYEPRNSRQFDLDSEPRYSRQSDLDYEPMRSPQSNTDYVPYPFFYKSDTYYEPRHPPRSDTDYKSLNGCSWSENHSLSDASSEQPPRPSSLPSFLIREPRNRSPSFRKDKKHNKDYSASTSDSYMSYRYPPRTLTETGMIKSPSSAAGSREIEWYRDETSGGLWFGCSDQGTRQHRGINLSRPPPLSEPYLHLRSRKDTDDGGPSFNSSSSVSIPPCTQSIAPTVAAPLCLRGRPTFIQDSTGGRTTQESESEPGDGDAQVEMVVTAVNYSVLRPRSHSIPSLSQSPSAHTGTGAGSLPNMPLETSFEEFTPDDDEHDETYRFQCSGPGLYRCSVTGLVFDMEGEGVLVYRTVPWSRRFPVQHHKRPAGPLFDIKCVQQSVCRLHLPHCEILSTGGGDFLSVAHVTDEDVEFISPHEITETHVIINITGFSTFGTVKDEDSPADPVRALVLLFYKPPADPDPESLLNVLLLPRNVVLRDLLRFRKKLDADERYIETSPHCKLQPKQEYSLSTRPEDDSVLVQPTEAEFDCDNYDNYFPSFQVDWETVMKHIKLLLRDTNSSHVVWERRVGLSSTGGRRSALNLPPPERLMDIKSGFIARISGPVLKSLLDKLLDKKVIGDSERESADVMQNNRDKARFLIKTVTNKGEAACSEMIECLCEADPFLCKDMGLI